MNRLLDLPTWMKIAIAAALLAALYGAFAIWRHVYQEGWDARDKTAQTELATERAISEELRGAIREQNRATDVLAEQKAKVEARGQAAQQLAAANGKRFDLALFQAQGAKATTCTEAMPTVNAILEAIR